MIKFGDRVAVIDPTYSCAELGEQGTIADSGYPTLDGHQHFLVRWDRSPDMLWGVSSRSIERIKDERTT